MTKSIRNAVEKYIGYKVDDALNGEQWTDQGAEEDTVTDRDWLLGWQCGFEPVFVVCRSYLPDVTLDRSDAIEYAIDYLKEILLQMVKLSVILVGIIFLLMEL